VREVPVPGLRERVRRVAERWNHLREAYPDRLAVFAALGALALGFAGYLAVSALGSGDPAAAGRPSSATAGGLVRPLPRLDRPAAAAAGPRTVVRRQVVLLHGTTATVSRVVTVPRTVLRSRTETVESPARTVVRSETAPTQTVTVPGPATTVTRTVVETTTVTVTTPAVTVTVTLPLP
jgi:hypothetical protein